MLDNVIGVKEMYMMMISLSYKMAEIQDDYRLRPEVSFIVPHNLTDISSYYIVSQPFS